MEANRTCILCGKPYYACNKCLEAREYIPWRIVACTAECYQGFLAYREYEGGRMSRERFREVLVELGFQGRKVVPDLQPIFDDVLGNTDKPAATMKPQSASRRKRPARDREEQK